MQSVLRPRPVSIATPSPIRVHVAQPLASNGQMTPDCLYPSKCRQCRPKTYPLRNNFKRRAASSASVHYFLRLLVDRHGKRDKRRHVHRHGNLLHSGGGGRVAVPATFFRNEVYEKHLPVDLESHSVCPFLRTQDAYLLRPQSSRLVAPMSYLLIAVPQIPPATLQPASHRAACPWRVRSAAEPHTLSPH